MLTHIRSIERLSEITAGAVYLLPIGRFPLPMSESSVVNNVIHSLIDWYQSADSQLSLEVIIRQSCLYTGLLDKFVDNAPRWMPQQGLAVIPHKPPPHLPTKDEIEGVDPRLINQYGVEGAAELPEFVFQITDEAAKRECCKVMSGHGALSVMLTKLRGKDLRNKWRGLFGAKVTDRHFRSMPLFVPLFGIQSFRDVAESELLSWFESFELYIGESKEDQGIVIASRKSLNGPIEDISKDLPQPDFEPEVEVLRW